MRTSRTQARLLYKEKHPDDVSRGGLAKSAKVWSKFRALLARLEGGE